MLAAPKWNAIHGFELGSINLLGVLILGAGYPAVQATWKACGANSFRRLGSLRKSLDLCNAFLELGENEWPHFEEPILTGNSGRHWCFGQADGDLATNEDPVSGQVQHEKRPRGRR